MSDSIKQLQPTILWKNFCALNEIPRASKNEGLIIKFIEMFGKQLNLDTTVDAIGNVIIKKPATSGMEAKDTIILQAHLDMVHQKDSEIIFDFSSEGIKMYIDGDWIKAKGTTLGADNGIGVAAILSVLESDTISHPAIEALFTIDEEIGMTGAMALKSNQLSGKKLLNLDTEEDNELTIGSAGGVDIDITGAYQTEELSENEVCFELTLKGLTGGHSGVDIHLCRGNAIKLLNRILFELNKKINFKLVSIQGGELTNVIPRHCMAIIAVTKETVALLKNDIYALATIIKSENNFTDPNIQIEIKSIPNELEATTTTFQNKLLKSIYSCPNGIYRMNPELLNLVQTSNNTAKIEIKNGTYTINCHSRSFIESERKDVVNAIESSFSIIGAKITEESPYPGWKPKPNTELVQTMTTIYEELYLKTPKINAIHAGLECGILSETFPNIEIISFGPNIRGAHSPEEKLQISSTQKFWQYLQDVLAKI